MKISLLWKRFLIGCFLLALLTGCATTVPETPTAEPTDSPEPTVIPTSIPTDTSEPTVTPLPLVVGTEFPTGIFESTRGGAAVEFREDGKCRWYSRSAGWVVSCKYAVNADLYTEMTFVYNTGPQVPATYYWTFDGSYLTFQLHGKDLRNHRRSVMGQTYLFVGETDSPPRVGGIEFPIGKFVLDGSRFYAIEFDEDGTWRDYETNVDVPSGSGKYATNGNLYNEMTHSYADSPQVPVTYYWTYDGKNLTFELWGEDVNPDRKALFDGRTYIKAE